MSAPSKFFNFFEDSDILRHPVRKPLRTLLGENWISDPRECVSLEPAVVGKSYLVQIAVVEIDQNLGANDVTS